MCTTSADINCHLDAFRMRGTLSCMSHTVSCHHKYLNTSLQPIKNASRRIHMALRLLQKPFWT